MWEGRFITAKKSVADGNMSGAPGASGRRRDSSRSDEDPDGTRHVLLVSQYLPRAAGTRFSLEIPRRAGRRR